MIEWMKLWANQIIIAVIIAVIFELILPNGKNKKYIKMVVNLYVLFVILNPIISKVGNTNVFDLSKYNYEEYFNNNISIKTNSSLNSDDIIIDTTKKKLKEDIKKKLLEKGYKATSINIDINNRDSNYGEINTIRLLVEKNVESVNEKENNNIYINTGVTSLYDKHQNNSSIQINEIENINISGTNKSKVSNLKETEIKDVKKIISKEYDISENKIEVN